MFSGRSPSGCGDQSRDRKEADKNERVDLPGAARPRSGNRVNRVGRIWATRRFVP